MRKIILIILSLLGNNYQIFGQSIIYGELIANNHNGSLVCSIYGYSKSSKKLLGKSDSLGKFRFQLPEEAETLLFSGNPNFRSIELPINTHQEGKYFLSLPLIKIDQQKSDKPYQQIAQKDLLINSNSSEKKNKVIRYLKIIDIDTQVPIPAKVCLFYTKTGLKDCSDVSPKQPLKISLSEDDIIAFEINTNQYQSYRGNLYIHEFENKNAVYEVGLTKTQSILAISNLLKDEVTIKNSEGNNSLNTKKTQKDICLIVQPRQSYHILNKQIDTVLLAQLGLNLLVLKPKNAEKIPAFTIPDKSKFSIQFNQSDFELLSSAKQTLDTISLIMQQKPLLKAEIIGFTDNVGSAEKNQTLSEFRAKVSLRYLVQQHIEESRLVWKGLGGNSPIAQNDTESNKARNRRVEIILKEDLE